MLVCLDDFFSNTGKKSGRKSREKRGTIDKSAVKLHNSMANAIEASSSKRKIPKRKSERNS